MNTILILGNNSTEGKSLVVLLHQWEKSAKVLTAADEQTAHKYLTDQNVNLIISNLNLTEQEGLKTLFRLTSAYPYIPCIAITNTVREAMRYGACYCLQSPFDTVKFLAQITGFLNMETRGTIRGIPIHSFLQMLEAENKTCTLNISTTTDTGYLYIRNGILIGAQTTECKGEKAIYEILVWENVTIEMKFLNPRLKQDIDKPLIYFIMEAFRKDDEKKRKREVEPAEERDTKLQHIMTSSSPVSLDLGSQIKMDFKDNGDSAVCTLVGMLHDKYLLITTPPATQGIKRAYSTQERLTIRYIHLGRLCMFKTTILKVIEQPDKLIFLDYPAVVHYREMRRSKRISTKIDTILQLKDGSSFHGILKEVSATGGLYHIKTKGNEKLSDVEIQDEISLKFNLPGKDEEEHLPGTIKTMQKNSYEINLGILFSEPLIHLPDLITPRIRETEPDHEVIT